MNALQLLIPCFFWLPLCWADGTKLIICLATAAVAVELGLRWVSAAGNALLASVRICNNVSLFIVYNSSC